MIRTLVIDDDWIILESISDTLTFEGYEVHTASDGLEGLQLARDIMPDIIICDINMPELDGYEVLTELRTDSQTSSIPFIFLSARASTKDFRIGMDLGADDYLTKPFQQSDLLNAIQTRLKRQSDQLIDRIRSFAHRIIVFQENERQNLAHLLQDDLAVTLLGLKMSLSVIGQLPLDTRSSVIEALGNAVDDAIQQINRQALILWPSTLIRLGLLPSILWYLENFTLTTKIQVDFQSGILNQKFDPQFSIMIYRIVQDALSNVSKHAGVDRVSLRLWVENNILSLQINDSGAGFNLEEVLKDTAKIGIVSMQERAALLDGKLTILSQPKAGTQIYAMFPLKNDYSLLKDISPMIKQFSAKSQMQITNLSQPLHSTKVSEVQYRVAIVDDNEIYRWGIRNMLESESTWLVVGEASNVQQALHLVSDFKPDILLISLSLPDMDFLQFVQQLYKTYPKIRVVILSNFADTSYVSEAFKIGIQGYVSKTINPKELFYALESIMKGEQYISSDIATASLTLEHKKVSEMDAFSTLTEREREIFELVIEGQTNKQIADKLFISPRTTETHRVNMMHKLGLKGQVSLVRYAIEHNLINQH